MSLQEPRSGVKGSPTGFADTIAGVIRGALVPVRHVHAGVHRNDLGIRGSLGGWHKERCATTLGGGVLKAMVCACMNLAFAAMKPRWPSVLANKTLIQKNGISRISVIPPQCDGYHN